MRVSVELRDGGIVVKVAMQPVELAEQRAAFAQARRGQAFGQRKAAGEFFPVHRRIRATHVARLPNVRTPRVSQPDERRHTRTV